jgi:hypothetical protein
MSVFVRRRPYRCKRTVALYGALGKRDPGGMSFSIRACRFAGTSNVLVSIALRVRGGAHVLIGAYEASEEHL